MHPEDDPALTLSKWPFYVGDVLLVSTALAIAILGDWQLTDWQVASCAIAVALGAALFVLPFVVEFYMRAQEISEDCSGEIRIITRRIERLESGLEALNEQLEVLVAEPIVASHANEALAEAVDQKLKRFDVLSADIAKLGEVLSAKIEAVDVKADAAKAGGVGDLSGALSQLGMRIDTLEAQLKECASPEVERPGPKRLSRKKRGSDSPLIHRAIKTGEGKSSAAVERIIQSSPKGGEFVKGAHAGEPGVGEEELDLEVREVEHAPVPAPKTLDEPPVVAGEEALDPEMPVIDRTDMLFDDIAAKPRASRVRVKKRDTVLTVNALIGIGNQPYVRGSGAGLNWETGTLMEFQEIGKWRWVASSEIDTPIEIEIYRNDEDADQSGRHKIEVGQKLELSPIFP